MFVKRSIYCFHFMLMKIKTSVSKISFSFIFYLILRLLYFPDTRVWFLLPKQCVCRSCKLWQNSLNLPFNDFWKLRYLTESYHNLIENVSVLL